MITLHIETHSLEELRLEACRALNLLMPPTVTAIAEPDTAIAKRPVGRPRKVAPEPLPEIDPVDDVLSDEEPRYGEDAPEEPVDKPDAVEVAVADVVALEKLKAETMILIQDMFAAGKVKHIRAVLDKHGNGAKSFPEIEAKEFPVINAALKAA